MKKRIGTRMYDTESSELISENGDEKIYRKRSRGGEFFRVIAGAIFPMSDDEVRALGFEEKSDKPTTIWVDRETHDIFMKEAKKKRISISQQLKDIAKQLFSLFW